MMKYFNVVISSAGSVNANHIVSNIAQLAAKCNMSLWALIVCMDFCILPKRSIMSFFFPLVRMCLFLAEWK